MQLENIAIRDMQIQDNVFIKDLQIDVNAVGHWKYKIDGIDFYVPNYGYLVLIDTNYKDIDSSGVTLLSQTTIQPTTQSATMLNQSSIQSGQTLVPRQYKIYGKIYQSANNPIDLDEKQIRQMNFQNFINIINPNVFSREFTNHGGVKPPEEIMKLLSDIYGRAVQNGPDVSIGQYIIEFMRPYLNTRIGTPLREREMPHIQRQGVVDSRRGDMVVQQIGHDDFIWVLLLERKITPDPDLGNTNVATVLTRESPNSDIIIQQIPFDSLIAFSKYEKIEQDFRASDVRLGEEDLLETYVIGSAKK